MTFIKSFALFTFKYKKQIFLFNAFFWPLLAGVVSLNVLVPNGPKEQLDGVEAQRIRNMLEDVKLKTREEKLDDAFHAMQHFMLPTPSTSSEVAIQQRLSASNRNHDPKK